MTVVFVTQPLYVSFTDIDSSFLNLVIDKPIAKLGVTSMNVDDLVDEVGVVPVSI